MSNISKKKLVKRFSKTPGKEYPLVNLYIIIFMVLEVLCELMGWLWPQPLLKVASMVLMIYYLHNKTSHMDYLVANLAKTGLVLQLISDMISLTEEELSSMFSKVFRTAGLSLYCLAFCIKQPIGHPSRWQKILLGALSILVIALHAAKFRFFAEQYQYSDFKLIDYLFQAATAGLVVISLFRYKMSSPRSFTFVWIGSVLLAGSVGMSATFKHFGIFWNLTDFLVSLSYYSAQYLLMHGTILHCSLQEAIQRLRTKGFN